MRRRSDPNVGQWAAIRRFPSDAKLIAQLMIRGESFRGLCDDLAEAERALAATEDMPEALRRARRAECEEWVEGLTNEIEQSLRENKVIPIMAAAHKIVR